MRSKIVIVSIFAIAVFGGLAGLYSHATQTPGTVSSGIVASSVQEGGAPDAALSPSRIDAQGPSQHSAPAQSAPDVDVNKLIAKYIPPKQDTVETRLKLSEMLYANNYTKGARGVFNSISDIEMCRYLQEKAPGTQCEGDIRVKLGEVLYVEGKLKLTKDILKETVSESVAQMKEVGLGAFQILRSAYRNSGELAKYDSFLESIPEEYPLKAQILMDEANFYKEEGNREKAKKILVAAVAKYPDNEALRTYMQSQYSEETVQ